jgi:hypothetical protein
MHTRFYHRARDKSVFVVHRRDEDPRRSLFALLRSIGLNRIEGRNAVRIKGTEPADNAGQPTRERVAYYLSALPLRCLLRKFATKTETIRINPTPAGSGVAAVGVYVTPFTLMLSTSNTSVPT